MQVKSWSLAGLCAFCLERELRKPSSVRLSNWEEHVLSDEQVSYARDNASVSLLVYEALIDPDQKRFERPSESSSIRDTVLTAPDKSDDGLTLSTSKAQPALSAAQRVSIASMINDVGNELESDWLLRPPTLDANFNRRLNEEKTKGSVVSRIT